jgi:hypothetical protein
MPPEQVPPVGETHTTIRVAPACTEFITSWSTTAATVDNVAELRSSAATVACSGAMVLGAHWQLGDAIGQRREI